MKRENIQKLMKTRNQLKEFCLFVTVFFSAIFAQAQTPPSIQWQKSLGGTGTDIPNVGRQTSDGGYILAGYTQSVNGDISTSYGNSDGWIVKLNSNGTLAWEKSIGTTDQENITDIREINGGYIIAGVYGANTSNPQTWVAKLSSNGSVVWEYTFGGNGPEGGGKILQTSDGYVILSGTNSSNLSGFHGQNDLYIIKLDNSGSLSWYKTLGGNLMDLGEDIKVAPDGNYIIAGYTNSTNGDFPVTYTGGAAGYDAFVIKVDKNDGSILWKKILGGTDDDVFSSIEVTADGNYILTGGTQSVDGDVSSITHRGYSDVWVAKVSNANQGTILWQNSYGGPGNEGGLCISITSDGGYVVVAQSNSTTGQITGSQGAQDEWVIKIDGNGTLEWQKSLGGTGSEFPNSVQQTTDGGYFVVGRTISTDGNITNSHGGIDFWAVKLSDTTSSGGNDTVASCITWGLLNDSLVTTVSGNVTGQPEILGVGSSAPLISVWGRNSYGQALWAGTNGWVQGPVDNARYVQFDVTPNSGNAFSVNNVSFDYSDFQNGINLNTIGFKVGYSIDNWSTTNFIGQGTYLGNSVQTFTASPNVVVPNGATFSLRIFPYGLQNQQAGSPTRATHKNIKICGETYPQSGCIYYDTVVTHVTIYDTVVVHVAVTDTLIIDVEIIGMPGFPNTKNALKAYPNPAHDHLIIDNGDYTLMAGHTIKVVNAIGQLVFTQAINQQQYNVDLSSWGGPGVYFISVIDSNQNILETKTIVIQ